MKSNSNQKIKKVSPSKTDDFGHQISRMAVSQICESTGFHTAHLSAVDTLADFAVRFIVELGKASHFYSNLSGRTSCNEFDIIRGLEDLSLSHGFASASNPHHCLVGSGVVREITQFVSLQEENPFARPVPRFPFVHRLVGRACSYAQIGEEPPKSYIPDWLPAFPDAHTYVQTSVWNVRENGIGVGKVDQPRQRRKGERYLLSLQKKLSCDGEVKMDKGKQVVGSNPFLASPLPASENGLPEIVIPDEAGDRKRVSELEAFKPVIEVAKNVSFNCAAEGKRDLPKRRPAVHFRFGFEKKPVVLPLSSKAFGVKNESRFLSDEKDDKKRRAEMILKEAMENPQELTQL